MQARAVSDAHRMLLGGGRVDSASGETIPVLNPANRSIFAHVPRAGAEDVDRAVKAAAEAFASRRDLRLFDELEFRDSKCLKQAMDSRFRGNDVISARRVAFRPAVIPAKAGIHFGQRIPKLEFDEDAVGSQNLLMSMHF